MISILRLVFLTRHGDVRTVWRLFTFLLLGSLVLLGLGAPAIAAGIAGPYVDVVIALAAAGTATFVMTRFINRKPFSAVGVALKPTIAREFGLGVLLGFLMMAGIFLLLLGLGYVTLEWRGASLQECVLIECEAVVLFGLAAFFEEFTFRGYLFQTLIQGITFLPATILFAAAFAGAHAWNPHTAPLALVNIALAGIWLSVAYMKTRRLWLPFGLHFSWNFAQTSVFGLPTSGIDPVGRSLVHAVVSGPAWVTGGQFGPEGGVLASVAIILCTAHILKSGMYRVPERIVTLDSLEDLLPRDGGEEGRA
jgi:membrane protease YdiL (CAAX protease family)